MISSLGGIGVLEEDPMMPHSQKPKEAAEWMPLSSIKNLQIGLQNIRTLYEAGKTAGHARNAEILPRYTGNP